MKTKIALAITVVTVVFVAWQVALNIFSEVALMERFPDIDPDDVIAASRKMYFAALKGDFADVDTNDDAVMDRIFLSYVNNL